jgi:hypothetical protein
MLSLIKFLIFDIEKNLVNLPLIKKFKSVKELI